MATATKPATKTASEPVEEYDFDNWTAADEEKAIAALAPDIKFIIVENQFVGRFPDGVIIKMPLSLSLDDVDAMSANGEPVDQFKSLLARVAGVDAVKEFTRHDLTETVVMAQKFFSIFGRIAKASLPE